MEIKHFHFNGPVDSSTFIEPSTRQRGVISSNLLVAATNRIDFSPSNSKGTANNEMNSIPV